MSVWELDFEEENRMQLYAVAFKNEDAYHFGDYWIEVYWADDPDHAREQAEDANVSAETLCVSLVPSTYTVEPHTQKEESV